MDVEGEHESPTKEGGMKKSVARKGEKRDEKKEKKQSKKDKHGEPISLAVIQQTHGDEKSSREGGGWAHRWWKATRGQKTPYPSVFPNQTHSWASHGLNGVGERTCLAV